MKLPTRWLRDASLKRRLMIASLISNGAALLLASLVFVTYELATVENQTVADLTGAAAIIGHNSAAALAFSDAESAAKTLQSLSTDPRVIGAALYDIDGKPFAQYSAATSDGSFVPPPVEHTGSRFGRDSVKLFYDFELAGEPAGTVYIEASLEQVESRVARYALTVLLVMLVSSLGAFLLSARLQHAVSGPIADLAKAMRIVRTKNDYSVRASKHGNDELGALIEGFNAMLDQIQAQDRALQEARDHLERRVEDRTHELQQEVSERKAAQAKLETTHAQLLTASRQAGMAEVATNVLHNVGNVLNSVNVSASMLLEQAEQSQAASLSRLATLFKEHQGDLAAFLTVDPRGQHVSEYIDKLAERLMVERKTTINELRALRERIDHIKRIVTMQQSFARISGVEENVDILELVEDALRMNGSSLQRHEIEIERQFSPVPVVSADKHKILQVLVNLVRNAKDACTSTGRRDKRIALRVGNEGERITVSVADNGVGIAPENMTRIFSHGFTTKKDGHGFGLHGAALAAQDLGGSLNARSDGPGHGATFTLELPLEPPARMSANG